MVNPGKTVINVYDFDHTLYKGDCSLDFYKFCLRRNPFLIRFLPLQLFHTLTFLLKLEDRTTFKSHFFVYLRGIKDIDRAIDEFWAKYRKKIKSWQNQTNYRQGIVISASPEFLLHPILKDINMLNIIATRMDERTGKIIGKNCRGEEKVRRLAEAYPDVTVEAAYSDHISDSPLLKLAKNAYVVKGEKLYHFTEK